MAGLGAMFIGMITGGIAMFMMFVLVCIFAAVIFIDAYRHGLKAWLWALMALLFNSAQGTSAHRGRCSLC